jgi:hypothetical protein
LGFHTEGRAVNFARIALAILAVYAAFLLVCAACAPPAADDEATPSQSDDDDGVGDDDHSGWSAGQLFPFRIDFDDYNLGDLPRPWQVEEDGATNFRVVAAFDEPGVDQELALYGGTAFGDHGAARLPLGDEAFGPADFEFVVSLLAGAAFEFVVMSDCSGEAGVALRLAGTADNRLTLYDYSSGTPEAIDCFPISSHVETRIGIGIFEDGFVTATLPEDQTMPMCAAYGQRISGGRLAWAEFRDSSEDGVGGDVRFDNFRGQTMLTD